MSEHAGVATPVARRVLVIDDEPRVMQAVVRALRAANIACEGTQDPEEGLRLALTHGYELVILDLLMPGTDGFSVLRQVMRARPEQAVLVLSCLSDVRSKVLSLSLGAEDYLGKPFHVDELLARVLARLRAAGRPHPTKIVHGPVTLDLLRRRVDIGTRSVTLSEREFLLFGELLRAAGKPVSKDQLLARCWGFGFDSNVVDVCVRRLRKHLGEEAITTVRGQGYCVDMA